ncbi:MAG: glycosyltransferase [Desulfobacterales bacterium]|nr:glycosyltransferase [Desulfobacterales bacterium]
MKTDPLQLAMFSIHSSPIGELGTKNTGGMSVYIRELARELGRRGHKVDIYTRLNGTRHDHLVDLYENVRLIHLSAGNNGQVKKLKLYYYLADFLRALEKFKSQQNLRYDLVHSHYWLSGRLGSWVQERWHIPHIVMFHTLGVVKNIVGLAEQEPDLRLATERKLVQSCQRILAPTAMEKQNLMKYYHAADEKIAVIPCGVNLDLFQPQDKKTARQLLDLDEDTPIALYVGRFDPIKGIERLLKAIVHLRRRQRVQLLIIGGDGPQTEEFHHLQHLINELGIQQSVTFLGRIEQKQLPLYYSAADVVVIPSYYESFGLVGLESLACGTPVVSTRVGAMSAVLQNNQIGFLVDNNEPDSLANRIAKVFEQQRTQGFSTSRLRQSVCQFGWKNVASSIINEYAAVVNGMPPEAFSKVPSRVSCQ